MTLEKSQQLAMPVVEVYLAIEEQILINIAKQLKEGKKLMEDDIHSWQLKKMMELGTLTQQNIITIAKHAGMAVNEVSKMLEEAGYSAVDEIEGDLAEAVQMGVAIQPPAIAESTAIAAVLTAYQRQARDVFNLVNTTMLQQAEQAYIDILNQTVGKVLTGVQTPQQALRETTARWAEHGIPALIDRKGRKWTTEAYVNTVMRSMSNRIANEMQDARMDDYGVDLIEVSSHLDARPKCAPYQGRIYSRSGRHPKYPPLSSTSYGDPAGLFGINCRHVKYPYIEGVSKQRFHPYDLKEVSKAYKQSQKQRYLERQIRYAKRELKMMEALGDQEGIKAARAKVRERQANMRRFIEETGLKRNYEREQVY
jgi:Phage minor capsid protein 2